MRKQINHKKELREIKTKDAEDMQRYIVNEDRKMHQREVEFQERIKKIQDKMNAMADTVVKNENEKRLKEERRLLQLQAEKEARDIQDELSRKDRIRRENKEINNYLMAQMEERKQRKIDNFVKDKEMQHALLDKNRQLKENDEVKLMK